MAKMRRIFYSDIIAVAARLPPALSNHISNKLYNNVSVKPGVGIRIDFAAVPLFTREA